MSKNAETGSFVSREADLLALLRECRTMIADLDAGWPTKELHCTPSDLLERVGEAVADAREWAADRYDEDDE